MKRKLDTSPLIQFFARTNNAVWLISTDRNHGNIPTIRVIIKHDDGSYPPPDHICRGGTAIALMNGYVGLYFQHPVMNKLKNTAKLILPEDVNDDEFGDNVGPVRALYPTKSEAMIAFNGSETANSDFECEEMTKKVLRSIGPNHPVFIVSRRGTNSFPFWFYDEVGIDRSTSPVIGLEMLSFGKTDLSDQTQSEMLVDCDMTCSDVVSSSSEQSGHFQPPLDAAAVRRLIQRMDTERQRRFYRDTTCDPKYSFE